MSGTSCAHQRARSAMFIALRVCQNSWEIYSPGRPSFSRFTSIQKKVRTNETSLSKRFASIQKKVRTNETSLSKIFDRLVSFVLTFFCRCMCSLCLCHSTSINFIRPIFLQSLLGSELKQQRGARAHQVNSASLLPQATLTTCFAYCPSF